MPPSLTKIWIHSVFSTIDCKPLIQSVQAEFEAMLYAHIRQHLEHDLKCYVQAINGMPDHLHVLYLLNANYAVKDILKNLKGESSHWINQHDFVDSRFAWEKGYEAFSVSDSTVETVVRHIQQQKEYHKTLSFREESHQLSLMHRLEFPALTI